MVDQISATCRLRERQEDLFPSCNLADICLFLHMAINGSADPWPDQQVRQTVTFLHQRLEHWLPSSPASRNFDDTVRQLVLAVLAEVQHYHPEIL